MRFKKAVLFEHITDHPEKYGSCGEFIHYKGQWMRQSEFYKIISKSIVNPSPNAVEEICEAVRMFGENNEYNHWNEFINKCNSVKQEKTKKEEFLLFWLYPNLHWLEDVLTNILSGKSEYFYFFYGVPKAGKSILMNLIVDMFGIENVAVKQLSAMNGNFGFSGLQSKLLLTADDLGQEGIEAKASGMMKTLITGGNVEINEKNKRQFVAPIYCNSVMGCNLIPYYDILDDGNLRRYIICEFKDVIKLPAPYKDIIEQLKSEMPELRRWCINRKADRATFEGLLAQTKVKVFEEFEYVSKCSMYKEYEFLSKQFGKKPYSIVKFKLFKQTIDNHCKEWGKPTVPLNETNYMKLLRQFQQQQEIAKQKGDKSYEHRDKYFDTI